jgi:putative ABC transport system substrate-binding protein
MNKVIWIALGALLFALCFPAEAQQPGKVPRIGFLQRRAAPTPANPDPLWDAFLKGLREFGYIDGKNIKIEHRYAEGRSDRLDAVIAEFIQLKVDVIVVQVVRLSAQPSRRPKRYPLSS